MARTVPAFPPRTHERYPWDTWLNGEIWQLTGGQDFTGRPVHFRQTVRAAAARRSLAVATRVIAGDVYLQAAGHPRTVERSGRCEQAVTR